MYVAYTELPLNTISIWLRCMNWITTLKLAVFSSFMLAIDGKAQHVSKVWGSSGESTLRSGRKMIRNNVCLCLFVAYLLWRAKFTFFAL